MTRRTAKAASGPAVAPIWIIVGIAATVWLANATFRTAPPPPLPDDDTPVVSDIEAAAAGALKTYSAMMDTVYTDAAQKVEDGTYADLNATHEILMDLINDKRPECFVEVGKLMDAVPDESSIDPKLKGDELAKAKAEIRQTQAAALRQAADGFRRAANAIK